MADLSKVNIVALLVGSLCLLLHIVGVATDYWLILVGGNTGLWQVCTDQLGTTVCISFGTSNLSARFNAARAMEILGILEGGLGLILLLLRRFQPQFTANRHCRWLPMVCFICAGILGLVGVILFCDPMDVCKDGAGWSFIITIIASCLYIIAAAPLTWKVSSSSEYQNI